MTTFSYIYPPPVLDITGKVIGGNGLLDMLYLIFKGGYYIGTSCHGCHPKSGKMNDKEKRLMIIHIIYPYKKG